MTWETRTGRRWRLREASEAAVDALREGVGLHPVVARILAGRGYDPSGARRFFAAEREALLDPWTLKGLPAAVDRIERALAGGEPVRLVTDYDVDGTTSCLILHAALDRRAGAAPVSYHIPDRFTEGYGLSMRAVETAAAEGVRLLVTADIGVRDHAAVARARELGVDVVVVDHHLPAGAEVPPDAVAVVCPPQTGCPYPNKALAACGVSLKLAQALLRDDPRRDELLASMLKLAAIGTVADVVDLSTPENRAIVVRGLAELNRGPHGPGLQALIEVSGLRVGEITAGDLGFRIGPRINAAGRLEDARAVVRLFRERDRARALALARELDRLNRERQLIQEDMVERALAQAGASPAPFVVVGGPEAEGWHRGVNGIVAARLRDRLGRPAAVYSVLGATVTGSVRSTPAVHAVRALDAVAGCLVRYGGHPVAAGFTLRTEDLERFREGLVAWVAGLGAEAAWDEEADVVVPGAQVDLELVDALGEFEPCGKGNPAPRLVVEATPTAARVANDRHLFWRLDGTEAVWWGAADRRELLNGARLFFGHAERATWNGRASARVVVEDVA